MASSAGTARAEPQAVPRPRRRPAARPAAKPRARQRTRPFGGVVWIVVRRRPARRRRRRERRRAAAEPAARRARARAHASSGPTTSGSARSSRAPRRPRASSRRRARSSGSSRPIRRSPDHVQLQPAGVDRAALQPPHSPAARPLRGRLRLHAGAGGLAPGRPGLRRSSASPRASRRIRPRSRPGRGTIFDRTGEPLAIGEQATTVYADPRRVTSPRRVAVAAAKALGLDANKLYPLLADRSRHFVYIKRKADPAKAAELEQQDLAGLGFYPEEMRFYPQRSVAAHVLGFAGIDNDGLDGLERSLEQAARGQAGQPDDRHRPRGPRDRRDRDEARAPRRRRLPHDRPSHPGERRGGAPPDRLPLERQGRHGDRARPAHGRGARDGGGAGLRREQVQLRTVRLDAATGRSPISTSPARRSRSSRSRRRSPRGS